ncbi:MAG: hypothetical protein J3K34DRAFT_518261 [Monoraphidium minutum]|nr:MAG: hypothetical protein J3K34DRAFT_518261 [Monoraphidium minutum]
MRSSKVSWAVALLFAAALVTAQAADASNRKLLGEKAATAEAKTDAAKGTKSTWCWSCGGWGNPGWGGGWGNPGWGGGWGNPGWGGGNSWSQASASAQSGSFGGPWGGGSNAFASASASSGSGGGGWGWGRK